MSWNFNAIQEQAVKDFQQVKTSQELEAFRIKYLGRKGLISQIFASLAKVDKKDKPILGKKVNDLRGFISKIIEEQTKKKKEELQEKSKETIDVTLPGVVRRLGHQHILTQTINEICGLFEKLGFEVQEGPEIETEYNNFSALNIPIDHPSRDSFDTFYLKEPDPEMKTRNLLLRSHTSPGQSRIMKNMNPPLAVVIPGKVYRPDAVDASHSFMFHQIEGLLVDKDIKFSDLKGLLQLFCQRLFGEKIKMRFRPHFFPFTEPSAEIDISCYICQGKGCSVCGRNGWLEIMGCGMVHPKVFEAVGYEKGKYTGLAFGLGVERITMLKYGINDIRIFFENDNRFLKQF